MNALASARPRFGFAVERTALVERCDVNFARLSPTVADFLARAAYPLVNLGDVVSMAQYGTSRRAVEDETAGPPMLRMVNLRDGDWDTTDLKYTTETKNARRKYILRQNDILFNRTNSKELVGKCAVFRREGEWIFASYLIRLRLRTDVELLPEFVARFLNSDVGRSQIDQVSRQIICMSNINAEEIRELMIPRPPLDVQAEMVEDLRTHWIARQAGLADVRELLAASDDELAALLGITLTDMSPAVTFAASRATMVEDDRINAEFFHPERIRMVRALKESSTPLKHLHEVANRINEALESPPADRPYLGLANVERDTGEAIITAGDIPEGSVVRFKKGDVLFSKLRPYLNKVHLAEYDGVCSPEFLVLRPKDSVRGEYLASILRSKLVLTQTRHMAGGNTHPRLLASDVNALLIPVPDNDSIQHMFADTAAERRRDAQVLRRKSEEAWAAAKKRFGDALVRLDESTPE